MGLWGGVFSEPTDSDLKTLNDSLPFDKRLYRQDIHGSIAYAQAIRDAGILTVKECLTITHALNQILKEFEAGTFAFVAGDEDIHTAVERRLIEMVGAVGGKLHTGRSRNDQVATDFRLWAMEACNDLQKWLEAFQQAVIEKAEAHTETLMSGYTHVQPAQPVTVAHWLMSYFWMVQRDRQRLYEARRRMSVSPLGAGALAGTPLPIDRQQLAKNLGFARASENSLDAVSDRDFVADMLYGMALLGTHLSRLAEDVILFSNPSFGFFRLHDRYSTGSSLMPQKRNADPMELTRGKAGRLLGNLTGLLATLKGLPTGYNKDLQEDKEALFDSFDQLQALLPVITAVVRTLIVNEESLLGALSEEMLATDLADYLVAKGLPFRDAHHLAGRAVRLAQERGATLGTLALADYEGLSALFTQDVYGVFDFHQSVRKRATWGGTAPDAVRAQIAEAKQHLTGE